MLLLLLAMWGFFVVWGLTFQWSNLTPQREAGTWIYQFASSPLLGYTLAFFAITLIAKEFFPIKLRTRAAINGGAALLNIALIVMLVLTLEGLYLHAR